MDEMQRWEILRLPAKSQVIGSVLNLRRKDDRVDVI